MSQAGSRVSAEQVERLERTYGAERVGTQLAALQRHGPAVEDAAQWLELALAGDFKPTGLEAVARCACGAERLEPLGRFVFWNLLGLRRCAACGTFVVTPRLDQPTVGRIFAESYFAGEGSNPEFWGARREPMFAEVLGLLRRYQVRRAFDVGAAYGHLLQYLGRHGISGAGCDLSPDVARWGREHLGVRLHAGPVTSVDEPAGSFDAVLCMDTLYYAHDPGADLRAMRRLLRPGGVLVLRLRNGRAARVRSSGPGGLVRPPMPLEHLWLFTPDSIEAVLRREGFEVLGYRSASYSDTRWAGVTAVWTWAAESLRRLGGGRIPPLTHSFYVVAGPIDG